MRCIVSGGQTGVDRAALDAAIALGLQHRGWCPRGRLAEDGIIPPHYLLRETEQPNYTERTRRNATESDATLILLHGELEGGTLFTWRFCTRVKKSVLVVRLTHPGPDLRVLEWLDKLRVETLNIAGPRASKQPAVYAAALRYLMRILSMEGP